MDITSLVSAIKSRSAIPNHSLETKTIYSALYDTLEIMLKQRLAHFKSTDAIYSKHRQTDHLGFERVVAAEVYEILKHKLGDSVYLDFPAENNKRIDLGPSLNDTFALIELKMYYSDIQNSYGGDFEKLKPIVDSGTHVMGCLIHFQFYANRNFPAQNYFLQTAGALPNQTYWSSLDMVGDINNKHFLVLGFQRL
jgi:hypothetical protein